MKYSALVIPILTCLAAPVWGQEVIAVRGATVETSGPAGRIENATLIVKGDKIEAVAAGAPIPQNARVIDGRGKTVIPGLIDPYHTITVAGAASDTGPRTVVIGGRTLIIPARPAGAGGPFTRIADNFYPYETSFKTMPRSGWTLLNLVSSGYGQSAIVRVTPDQPESMLVNADGVLFTPVSNESASLDVVRTALEAADRLARGMSLPAPTPVASGGTGAPAGGMRRPGGPGGGGGRRFGGPGPGAGGGGGLNPASLRLWQAIHQGKAPLFASASNAAAILHLSKLLEPYRNVKVVLTAPATAIAETIDQLKGKKVCVLIAPALTLKPNTRDRIDLAALLHQAGIEFAFTQPPNLTASQDAPLFPVAYLVRCGLPRQVALDAMTRKPAAILGMDKSHGTIEVGKSADFLIFDGDPLDPGSLLQQTVVAGRVVHEN